MKNSKLTLAILAMVVATLVSVVVVSCKKEDNESKMSDNKTSEMSASDTNMDEYLISFKNKLLSAQKGDKTISLEQAERDLGNLLNFDFGDANYATNICHHDTLHTSVDVADGMVDLSELAVTYSEAKELITKAFEMADVPEKSVYTIACSVQDDGNVELILTTRGLDVSERAMQVNSLKTSFDTTDCWSVFFSRGRCDGTDMGYDHVQILQLVYHNNLPISGCENGTVYYTDVTQGTIKAINYPETGTPVYNDGYRLWVGDYMDFHYGYVEYAEMVYYYNNLCSILNAEISSLNDPDIRITSISCTILQDDEDLSRFTFICKYEYGTLHCSPGGPVD